MGKAKMYSINGLLGVREILSSTMGMRGVKFSYAVAKNIQNIETRIRDFRDKHGLNKPNKDYDKFMIAKRKLEEDHGKVVDGKIVKDKESGAIIIKDQKAFDKDLEALKIEHKAAQDFLVEREKVVKVLAVEENIPMEFHKIMKESDMSDDITPEIFMSLGFMINY